MMDPLPYYLGFVEYASNNLAVIAVMVMTKAAKRRNNCHGEVSDLLWKGDDGVAQIMAARHNPVNEPLPGGRGRIQP